MINYISYAIAVSILLSPFYFENKLSKAQIASLTITLGILGTFTGVFIGLWEFNTSDIANSIPNLIDGLKTAFLTSIAGLTTNIIIRIKPSIYGFKNDIVDQKSDNLGEQMIKSLDRIDKSLSGDGESSMVTQIQKLRDENGTNLKNLTDTNYKGLLLMSTLFEDFAEKMVADSTQSLINALTKVMQDFNTKINDQFGENFKELNSAVKAMVIWQENYKNQVETLTSQFTKISENIHGIDRTLQTTAENHKVIYQTNEILKQVISDFSETVSSFSELGRQARDSFPIIEQNMNSLTESSNKYVRDSLSDIKLNYDEFSRNQKQISENYKSNIDQMILDNAERIKNLDNELGKELNKSLESLGSHLTTLSKHFVDDYKPLTEQLRKLLQLPKEINDEN
jgi:hypothetical protein